VIAQCQQALKPRSQQRGGWYLMGCAHMRLNQPEPAVQPFGNPSQIDPPVTAVHFQLAAQTRLGHLDEAISEF